MSPRRNSAVYRLHAFFATAVNGLDRCLDGGLHHEGQWPVQEAGSFGSVSTSALKNYLGTAIACCFKRIEATRQQLDKQKAICNAGRREFDTPHRVSR